MTCPCESCQRIYAAFYERHPDFKPDWDNRPRFPLDADVTIYWPDVRPCWEPS